MMELIGERRNDDGYEFENWADTERDFAVAISQSNRHWLHEAFNDRDWSVRSYRRD